MLVVLKCPKVTIHLSRCDDNNLQIIIMVYTLQEDSRLDRKLCRFWTHTHFIMQQTAVRECQRITQVLHYVTCLWCTLRMIAVNEWGRHLAHRPHTPISIAPCALALAPTLPPTASDSWCRPCMETVIYRTYHDVMTLHLCLLLCQLLKLHLQTIYAASHTQQSRSRTLLNYWETPCHVCGMW